MTEWEWQACLDPQRMLCDCCQEASERKLRLLACACLRMVEGEGWYFELSSRVREVLVEAERHADGRTTSRERIKAPHQPWKERPHFAEPFGMASWGLVARTGFDAAIRTAVLVVRELSRKRYSRESQEVGNRALGEIAALVRDVFGPLSFRQVATDPSWLTSTAVILAKGVYDSRAFDRLPILADALQDAGCENTEILDHCRGGGPHVRGCWVVDLVLGKT
jgi:hypothetical protein